MIQDIHAVVTRSAKELANQMDEKIMEFFGSEEHIQEYGHLFVIEELPTGVTTVPSEVGTQFIFHVETEIRIRPKTMAELEAN